MHRHALLALRFVPCVILIHPLNPLTAHQDKMIHYRGVPPITIDDMFAARLILSQCRERISRPLCSVLNPVPINLTPDRKTFQTMTPHLSQRTVYVQFFPFANLTPMLTNPYREVSIRSSLHILRRNQCRQHRLLSDQIRSDQIRSDQIIEDVLLTNNLLTPHTTHHPLSSPMNMPSHCSRFGLHPSWHRLDCRIHIMSLHLSGRLGAFITPSGRLEKK
jgi:hypothetical protein